MTRILAGRRSILEALRGHTSIRRIYVETQRVDEELEGALRARRLSVAARPRAELDQLANGVRHQGVVAIADDYRFCEVEDLLADRHQPLTLVALDQITDPQNLGAIIRSAVTLGLHGVLVQKHRSATITASVVRASAGATEHAAIARVTNLQKTLLSISKAGLEIIGLDASGGTDLRELEPETRGRVLVVGSEGKGLRRMVRERCDRLVQIRQEGPMDSLNASVAAAIAMYEITGKRIIDGG